MLGDKWSWRWHMVLITHKFTQIILKWIGFFSYSSDLKLTSHHTYVMHYLTQHYKKCFLSRVDWLVTELKKKTKKQRNKKQNNWLFTEVGKVAHEQFKWGFPNAGDS